jgi:hypothetical protein
MPKTFREATAAFLQGIASRPPVLMAALSGLVTALTGNVELLEPYKELIGLAVGSYFGYLASRLVVGPKTAEALANAVLDAKQSDSLPPAQVVEKARAVIEMPNVRRK